MTCHPITFDVDDTASGPYPGAHHTWKAGESFARLALWMRHEAGLSQAGVEKALDLSSGRWSGWERGRMPPDVERLPAMAEHFDVPLARLLEARANTVRVGWLS